MFRLFSFLKGLNVPETTQELTAGISVKPIARAFKCMHFPYKAKNTI